MEFLVVVIIFVAFLFVCSKIIESGNRFRDGSQQICVGMTNQDVLMIMGEPSFTKTFTDGSYEYIYEKSEWKGVFRGGTQTRRMECVFSPENILISVGKNKNCDRSGW